ENSIMRTIDVLEKTKNRGRIKIAFDEWNLRGWTHPGIGTPKADIPARAKNDDNSTYTTADAIFSACFLNSCLRHCSDVEIACFSPIVNVRGALYVYPEGIVHRSTFYVFKMYANELEKNVLPTSLAVEFLPTPRSATPVFDAILTCDDAGKNFALAVINKDPENSRELRADFLGIENGAVSALVLSGESPDDYNDVGRETVVPREVELKIENGNTSFPPHSISIVKFSRN
ncbi:MAG: alpha-N-arabinofuranosidase, partial [Thermoguttaceae bacterium]|nr:alpha-N-arabinofuranosidase [Thermoguttaceae bacterium]